MPSMRLENSILSLYKWSCGLDPGSRSISSSPYILDRKVLNPEDKPEVRTDRLAIALLLVAFILQFPCRASAVPPTSIFGRIVDAYTGDPIPDATVLIWDVSKLDTPRPGAGIYVTDAFGAYNATSPYIVPGHSYWVYAYKGNMSSAIFEYVPSARRELPNLEPGGMNVSSRLVPGATIVLIGQVWDFNSTSPPYRAITLTVVAPLSDSAPDVPGASYVTAYGGSVDAWFLGLPANLTIVPSGVKVELKADAWFFSRDVGIFKRSFRIDNDRQSFLLEKSAPPTLVQLADYSLRKSADIVSAYVSKISSETDEAQRIGFYAWEERISLGEARNELQSAMSQIQKANYLASWLVLREAYMTTRAVHETLGYMRLVASANAVYMPAVFAVFAVVLGFFAFEENRKKLFASVIFYAMLIVILFMIYPGTKILASEDFALFAGTALISILVALAITFGIPRVWKERDIEGQVSLRSVIPVIFSMAKRQVWRHRSRSLFAILSIVILVLAFTSLTSFGTVYGLMSSRQNQRTSADGVMIKRLQPNSTQWTEIPQSDLDLLSTLFAIHAICPKAENIPSSDPIAAMVTADGQMKDVYGVLGLDPELEPQYIQVQQVVTQGDFLSSSASDGILVSNSAAADMGIGLHDRLRFVVRGKPIMNMTVIGFFDDQRYSSLQDFDGRPFGPSRELIVDNSTRIATCNGTDVIMMSLQTALRLQKVSSEVLKGAAPQFAVISRIMFTPDDWQNLQSAIHTLTFAQEYTVYESRSGTVTSYYLGFRYETKGATEVVIPVVMVVLNVAAVMLNSVYERRKEMQVLTLVGLNPVHIGTVFVAEAIVVGLVGGGIGYIFGLGFYQIMTFFGEGLTVRAKLEWWWSAVGLALALVASILSALRPAMIAVTMYTPSMRRRTKVSQKEKERRKKEVFKVYQAAELSMPVRLLEPELLFFLSFVLDRLRDLQTGIHETARNIEEIAPMETPEGDKVNGLRFEFYKVETGAAAMGTKNVLTCVKKHDEDFYRVLLKSGPATDSISEEWADRTVMMVRDVCLDWVKNKQRLIGSQP
jgi:ABC-type lipoprotein release transport system permease subunit